MADVVFNLSADEGRFVGAMLNALNAQQKVKDEFKNIKQSAKEAEEQYIRMGRAAQEAAERSAAKQEEFKEKVEGVATAVGTGLVAAAASASKALADMYQHAIEKGKNFADQLQQLQGTLTDFGNMDLMPDVLGKLGEMNSQVLSRDQIKNLYSQISRGSDRDVTPEMRMAATAASVEAADAGFSDPAKFGTTFTALGKLDAFKNMDKRQLSNLTAGVIQQGGLDEEMKRDLERGQAAGGDASTMQRIIELGLARQRGGESGKAAGALLQEAFKEIRPEDIATKFRDEKDPAAQEKIKGLEKEKETIESRQRQLEDREHVMAREREEAGKLKGSKRKKALDALDAEHLNISDEQLGLSRQSSDIGGQISELNKHNVQVAEADSPEVAAKKELFGLSFRGRINALLAGKGVTGEHGLAFANLAKNMPDFDVQGAAGEGGINFKGGALSRAREVTEANIAASPEFAGARELRRAQVERLNQGQSIQAIEAAAVKEDRERRKENAGVFEHMANSAPGVDTLQTANDMKRAQAGEERLVKQSRSLAGKDQEQLRNGGNE